MLEDPRLIPIQIFQVRCFPMTEENIMIRFENLTKKFGSFTAVKGISLEISRGEIVGFLGPNGAGKSTTMKLMANLISPTAGEVWIRHNGVLEKMTNANKDLLMAKMGFLIETPVFYDNVTPRQILTYFAKLKAYPKHLVAKRVEDLVAMVKLSDWIDKPIKNFSKGMNQKIGIISTIVHDPEIVVLDEPHSGLDPKARKEVRDFILSLKAQGKTIFLSSHLLYEISEIADKIAFISHGELLAYDTLKNLELKTQHSTIQIELEDKVDQNAIPDLVERLTNTLIKNKINLIGDNPVRYNTDLHVFEVNFDGTSKNQKVILNSFIQEGIAITTFSVPKANLLEKIYLDFVAQPEINPATEVHV
jgi:ABC-2 type transport system ATP-binding protein